MISAPESLQERFIRVSKEQKRSLIVCADDFRHDLNGIYSHGDDMGIIGWRMAERAFEELLPTVSEVRALVGAPGAGKSTWLRHYAVQGTLYFDSMLSRRVTRRVICEMAATAGKEIDCILFLTDLKTCLVRNSARRPDRVVPSAYLKAAYRRLRVCPPGLDEGWRRVLHVKPDSTALGHLSGGPLDSSNNRP